MLQAVGALSILPYPFVLLANIMSMAATGHNSAGALPFVLLSFYPMVWIMLWVVSWRAMSRGSAGLAFGLSSVPLLAMAAAIGIYIFGWVGFALGSAGAGPGGLHSYKYPNQNPVIDAILLAGQRVDTGYEPAAAVDEAMRAIDGNAALVNTAIPVRGSPLNAALGNLNVSLDGTVNGNAGGERALMRLVRSLVSHGAHLTGGEATDIRKTWLLRRALTDGPVTTASENRLVWRIVTHDRGESKPWDPMRDPLPPRRDTASPFVVRDSEMPLLNQSTRLHGTPLYAALLEQDWDACGAIIRAGGKLSVEEERDPAATAALHDLLERQPALRNR